ncbi:MAG: hypothetical protein U0Q19_12645 [Kineosporiaceae bacterium]
MSTPPDREPADREPADRESTDREPAERVSTERDLAERWFAEHGLPWFVDGVDTRVAALVAPARLIPVAVVAVAAGTLVGAVVSGASDLGNGVSVGVTVVLAALLLYASGPLRVATMGRWAARRMIAQVSLLFPLALRALPLLLLFTTFLFINTEVWQVVGGLRVARVAAAVLVFAVMGAAFLLTRLPEEVRRVEAAVAAEGLVEACAGTPLAERAARIAPPAPRAVLSRAQRVNLVLVLLAAQTVQVALLSVAVFGFFLGFGVLIMQDRVISLWMGTGAAPSHVWWDRIGLPLPISAELAKVSVFLAAFAALYFTIYAVSDATYRREFFAEIDTELTRAVGVRAVYAHLVVAATDADRGEVNSAGDLGPW